MSQKPVRKASLAFLMLCAILMLCAMSMPVATAAAIDNTQGTPAVALTKENRQAILQGLKAARQDRWTEAKRLVTQTQDKAALSTYEWLYFTKGVKENGTVEFDRIAKFIKENPEWPRQNALKLLAERSMPATISDAEMIAWFDQNTPQTATSMSRYVAALNNQGRQAVAKQRLNEWWPRAALNNTEQAFFLDRYAATIDKDVHVARFNTVLFRQQYTNARALARMIGKGYPALADARIALAQNTPDVNRLVQAVPAHLQDDPGFMLERLRWRRKNNMDFGAIEILQNMPPAEQIPNLGEWWKERNIIARRLIEKKDYRTAYIVVARHGMKQGADFAAAEFMAGWLALRFNKQADKAFGHFEALYNGTATPISRSRGAYWAGKASKALKQDAIATQWYQAAARYQTAFYGQMAIGELEAAQRPPQQVAPRRAIGAETRFYSKDIVKAARLLHDAGYWRETTEFLDAMSNDIKDPEEYILIADLAESLEHYHNAVRIGKKGLEKNIMMVDHAFPTILPRMRNVQQEWALVHGLIRQESQFDPQARSPVGAMGLMQIMPATGKEVAKRAGIPHQNDWLISRPDHNIAIGERYLGQLLRRYDGSYPLALAAYNGGMGNVDKWIARFGDPRKGEIDMIDWVEMIPFDETRNYVQRVMESTYIYRLKMRALQHSVGTPLHASLE